MSTLSLAAPGSNQGLLPEKRPTFAFHRRIRDDPAFHVELPSDVRQRYPTAVKPVSGAIHNLVEEWTAEWLAGTRSDADAEVRLRGMLEEVLWGNVIWYGVGGWATRGDSGRAMNADFFLCVSSLILSNTIPADLLVPCFERLPIKCTSRHLNHLPAWCRSQGRRHITVLSVQTWHTPILQPPPATPKLSSSIYSMEDLLWKPPAANRGLLRGHRRTTVCTRPSGSGSLALARQRVDAHHPERDPGTGRTHAQDRPHAHRFC